MIGEYNQFIAKYRDVLTTEECEKIILWGETKIEEGVGVDHNDNSGRKDICIFMNQYDSGRSIINELNIPQILVDHLGRYSAYYDYHPFGADMCDERSVVNVKSQKSWKGGGFTQWHCEIDGNQYHRFGVWMFYLNDCDGRTDFKFQELSFTPKAGTLLIFPATWTHYHRANPDLTEDKYIITGWYEFPHDE